MTAAIADDEILSVPVRILNAAQPAPEMASPMPVREAPPVATPAARMPQYQLQHSDFEDTGRSESAQVRFVLATPERPLLIEVSVLIDGQPFRLAREARIQEIMRYIADPVAFKAEADRIAAEAQAAAAVASEPEGILESILDLISGDSSTATLATPDPNNAKPPADESPSDEQPPAEESIDAVPESGTPSEADTTASPQNADAPPAEPVVPAVARYVAPATIYERIERYIGSTGTPPTEDEVRWLLANWVDGPILLFLNDNFQRFRADQQPVFRVLDSDRDGIVSAAELAKAVASFQTCDLNRDAVVDATELAQSARDVRNQTTSASGGKLIYRLPNESTSATFLRRLAFHYPTSEADSASVLQFDRDSDGVLSSEEVKQLHEGPADVRLRIELTTGKPESSRLTIEGFSDDFVSLRDSAKTNATSVTLNFPSFNLEFLAAQGSGSDQISIGAVNDGYAMLQEIDPNTDGRFSIRELRQLNQRLSAFDRNSDGQITTAEIRPTFRVCIGLGPTAHELLALLREANSADSTVSVSGPEWFTEMDKNKDYDLTRQEFPGIDEQFQKLDRDGDELISSVEANES